MLTLLAALYLLSAPDTRTVVLQNSPLDLPLGHQFSQAENGTFLLVTNKELLHWDRKGQLTNRFQFVDDKPWRRSAVCVFYFSEKGHYWISGVKKSKFFDRQGKFLGFAKTITTGGKLRDVSPRYFQKTKNHLFIGGFREPDLWADPEAPLLSKVRYRVGKDNNILVEQIGADFCSITLVLKQFHYNFKLHYLVEDPYHGNIFVANQMENKIRQFGPDPRNSDHLIEYKDKTLTLPLPKYVKPPNGFANATFKAKEEFNRWMFSWSQINGLFLLDKDFLVAFKIPDPDNPLAQLQMLQRVTRKGKVSGRSLMLPGTVVGIYRDAISSVELKAGVIQLHITKL